MKAKTYDEWKELGYQVKRGEKCTGRLPTGKGTFTREHVDPRLGDYYRAIQLNKAILAASCR